MIEVKPNGISKRSRKRNEVIELLGGRCVICGTEDHRVFQINHKYNDGFTLKRGGRIRGFDEKHFTRILDGRDDAARYEILCANCHMLRTNGYV